VLQAVVFAAVGDCERQFLFAQKLFYLNRYLRRIDHSNLLQFRVRVPGRDLTWTAAEFVVSQSLLNGGVGVGVDAEIAPGVFLREDGCGSELVRGRLLTDCIPVGAFRDFELKPCDLLANDFGGDFLGFVVSSKSSSSESYIGCAKTDEFLFSDSFAPFASREFEFPPTLIIPVADCTGGACTGDAVGTEAIAREAVWKLDTPSARFAEELRATFLGENSLGA